VLREVETNPGYYIEQAIDGVADELGDVVPYSAQKATAIIGALERTAAILEQGPRTLVLQDAAPELAQMGRGRKTPGTAFPAGTTCAPQDCSRQGRR
jgi:hypothetical protein